MQIILESVPVTNQY